VFRALATSLGFNLMASALGSVSILLAIAVLEPSIWGASAAILGVGQFLGAALSFGSQVERIRRYSRLNEPELLAAARVDSIARLMVTTCACTVSLVTALVAPTASLVLLTAAGVFASLGATNHLIALRRYASAGALHVTEKLTALVFVGAFAWSGTMDSFSLAQSVALSGLIVGLASLAWLRPTRRSLREGVRSEALLRIWSKSLYLGIASLAPSALLLDVGLVVAVAGASDAGLFAVATKLTAPLSIAASAIVAVLLPHLAASSVRSIPRPGKRGLVALSGMLLGLTVVFLAASWWVPTFFGAEYEGAIWPVRFYVLNVVVILGTRALATVLQAWDDDRFVSLVIACQVIVALVGIAVGALAAGAFGASLAVLATNLVLAGLLWRRVRLVELRSRPS